MFYDEKKIKRLKEEYPKGTIVEMTETMDDIQPILKGERGVVELIDDAGQIHVRWDSGRGLALNIDVDSFKKVES